MSKVTMLNMAGQEAGELELKDEIFGIAPNQNAVHAGIKNILADRRQGTQSAKTRAEVRGGGRKPFRQKGTGRHRQGSSTDPSQVGGGVVFAPKPRSYRYTLPKKLRRLAMLSALSSTAAEKELIVIDEIKFADIRLDLNTHDLSCGEKSVHLSGKEFEVLSILMGSSSRVVSKQDLLTRVWGTDGEASENSVEAYVSFIRKKLTHIGSKVQVTTLRMLGYRLEVL